MASGSLGDSCDDLIARARCRWTENSIVYTRRNRRKAQKTSTNDDIPTTTTCITEKPNSLLTASTKSARNQTEVSSAVTATAALVSTTVSADDADNCAAVSLSTTDARSTPHRAEEASHAMQESVVTMGKDDDSSLQPQQAQEPLQHQEHRLSGAEKNSQDRVPGGSGSRTAELQNLEDLLLPNINEVQDLEKLSPLHRAVKPAQTCEEDIPNNKEVDEAQITIRNEAEIDRDREPGSPQVRQSNDGSVNVNGVVKPLVISSVDDRIKFNLSKATAKNEVMELKRTLLCQLDQVTRLVKQLEAKEHQIAPCNTQIGNSNLSNTNYISANGAHVSGYIHPQPQHNRSDMVDRRLSVRVNSEVGRLGHQESRHVGLSRVNSDMGAARDIEPRPYSRQLNVAVTESNSKANEFIEKEKRTPKANQFYRNSEFLLGKDRLPSESNKRLKTNNGRKHSGETEHAFGFGFGFEKNRNHVFKNCSGLLQRLMKHKHGWVFNEPVNAKALGLADYHDVIKHPMDLGTIKTRLSQNWYKSPRNFAEDVRLVFRNAMTYNPKGQDVHIMAEQLLQIFEERWGIIEAEFNSIWKHQMYYDGRMPTPTSRRVPPQSHFGPTSAPMSLYVPPSPQMRTSDRPEPVITPMAVDPKIQRPHVGRTPVPKKPKAKDPNKRDMTYEEKQRLSTNLQGLPSEKLDAIVQIIKRRNTALSQHDDEIEVDIDSVDAETLWELDRFVTNYKKSLSKNKRKAELALQARTGSNQNVASTNSIPAVADQIGSGAAFEKSTDPAAEGEKQGYNGCRSSSSSSSSSDSGSSSSDSDSDSSSADGSDAGHSPRS